MCNSSEFKVLGAAKVTAALMNLTEIWNFTDLAGNHGVLGISPDQVDFLIPQWAEQS
jgi:hypothetical protein